MHFKKNTSLTVACISLFMGFVAVRPALAGNLDNVKTLLNKAQKEAKALKIPAEGKDAATEKAVTQVMRKFNSPAYQNMLHNEINKVRAELHPGATGRKQISYRGEAQNSYLLPDERIYLFISSSIPMNTLKNYAAVIDKLKDPHITMVMRGFIHGMEKIKPTMQFIRKIMNKNSECSDLANCPVYDVTVKIDPLLFSRYDINTVPAILYATEVNSIDPQKSEGIIKNTSIGNAYLVNGDVSLEYALKVIERQSHSSQIAGVLTRLRKGFYN